MSDDVVVLDAPAKVNLRLRVLAREASGYHQLETLFCALELCDTVEVRRLGRPVIELDVVGDEDAGPPERNLCRRAAEAYAATVDDPAGVAIRLTKRVPVAAGLGGGSSDAAATLRAVDALHGRPLGRGGLLRLAAELGSDVAFFLCGSPLALGWGRGERLLPLQPLEPREVVIAVPPERLPTAEAFRMLSERLRARPEGGVVPEAEPAGWDGVAAAAANAFEDVVYEHRPELRQLRDALRDAGARLALLAGSGASVFGVFDDAATADRAAASLPSGAAGMRLLRTRTARR